jgi:hypothetical protein
VTHPGFTGREWRETDATVSSALQGDREGLGGEALEFGEGQIAGRCDHAVEVDDPVMRG